ncbi:MAG TPA: alanine dehydrogenase [Dehalococcoidia bacterium]|nr:alanine dehydrogenase [Dehalococcoidia bacterium]
MVTLGVLKETKPAERRVTLVPDDVRRLRDTGATIVVQRTAGDESGFADEQFAAAGARFASTPDELIAAADVVIKVKEPTRSEIAALRPGQLFLSFLHLAAFPELIAPLCRSGATALGYETIAVDGRHPVLRPMSAVAGALALQIGEHYLEATSGGRGVLLPGIEGKHAGKVVIVGSGVVGEECGRLAYGEGVRVVFVDANPRRLDELHTRYPLAGCLAPDTDRLNDELADADLLVGGVYINGARAPHVVSRTQIARMPSRSVAVDVAIDQGGCFETSHPTSHADPVYEEAGVLHYCVTNIPSMVPRSASIALSHALTPYLETVLRLGPERALEESPVLADAVNISGGSIVLDSLKALPASA